MSLQFRIAHSDLAKELARLLQAWAICATFVVLAGKLNRIVYPPANFT